MQTFADAVGGFFVGFLMFLAYREWRTRQRRNRLRAKYAGLSGRYSNWRAADGSPTGGSITWTPQEDGTFQVIGYNQDGSIDWKSRVVMSLDHENEGEGIYEYEPPEKHDAGTQYVHYFPETGSLLVRSKSTLSGREFAHLWKPYQKSPDLKPDTVKADGTKEKAEIAIFLGTTVLGTAGLGVARLLASLGHPKIAIWVCYLAILAYTVAARSFVISRQPLWKARTTWVAVVLALVLLPGALWLHGTVRSLNPSAPSIQVESSGDQSPNVVGNQGPVTIQSGDSATNGKPPKQPPKSDGKSK